MFPFRVPDYSGLYSDYGSASSVMPQPGNEAEGKVTVMKAVYEEEEQGEGIEIHKPPRTGPVDVDAFITGDIERGIESGSKVTERTVSFENTTPPRSTSTSFSETYERGGEEGSFGYNIKHFESPRGELRHSPDPSLILGMERTLFAALNNAWLVSLGGIGLMSVGSGDMRATYGGIAMLIGGVISAVMAFGMHFWRILQLQNRQTFRYAHTIFWSSMIAAMTVVTLILEMYFGICYPYLQREKAVSIANHDN